LDDLRAILVASDGQDSLFSYACKAIRHLRPCAGWQDIAAPVRTAIGVIRAVEGRTGHGLFWRGRPPWLTDARLDALDQESMAMRPTASTFPGGYHRWAEAGPHAQALTQTDVRAFIEAVVGRELGPARATYNYYERPGEEAYPHIDQPEYGLNALCMLSHEHEGQRGSSLWLYPEGEAPVELPLQPGEVVIFHARSTVHQRTPVVPGERVRVVTVGYLLEELSP
jgi:hypothetical protein